MLPQWQTIPWQHPRVLQRYPTPDDNPFRRLLLEHERFLTALDQMPHTLCHGDAFPTNFMSRHMADGQEQTIALDWALMGVEPLGHDLGQLVLGAHLNFDGRSAPRIHRPLVCPLPGRFTRRWLPD